MYNTRLSSPAHYTKQVGNCWLREHFAIWRQLTKRAHDSLYLLSIHIACISQLARPSEEMALWQIRAFSLRTEPRSSSLLSNLFPCGCVGIVLRVSRCSQKVLVYGWENKNRDLMQKFPWTGYYQAFFSSFSVWRWYGCYTVRGFSATTLIFHLHFRHRKEESKN